MTDTPELFGGELRILAAIDVADGKIIRWVDYWDSTTYDTGLYTQFRTPAAAFPADFKDTQVPTRAASAIVTAATALQQAFGAGDAPAAAELMHTDVVVEDMALRSQVIGRIESARYLHQVLDRVPYGRASRLRHVVGGDHGGGFEWTSGSAAGRLAGITALELDTDGLTGVPDLVDQTQPERVHDRPRGRRARHP